MLVIGNRNYSSWSLRPWLLMRHHGIAFDERLLALDTPEFEAQIAHWSPTGRVPALHHQGLVVWDSLAICEYVSEAFLDGRGWPRERAARATARAVSAEMHAGFTALRSALPMNVRRHSPGFVVDAQARRDIARIQALWTDCRARFGAGGAFLFGAFSIADAMYAPVVLRLVSYDVPIEGGAQAWVDRMRSLDAMQAWIAAATAETERLPETDRL